jgi:hypothetical protein
MLPRGLQPRSGSGWKDGLANAPRGRPQRPTLLDRYGPNRPPWNVAGVDYRVGVPEGLALKDWRTMPIPPLGSVNTTTGLIYIGADCVLDGIDFSLGCGAEIYNPGGNANNITIRNCKFGCPPGTTIGFINDLIHDQNGANIVISYCTFDGTNINQMNQFVTMDNSGSILNIKYCHFINSQAQQVAFNGAALSTWIFKFNLIDNTMTKNDGAHMNWGQMYGIMALSIQFNTGLQYMRPGGEGFQPDAPSGMPSPVVSNNTFIALPYFVSLKAPVTATNASPCVFTSSGGNCFLNDNNVVLTGTTAPGGFVLGSTTYWVVNADSSVMTFQLSATYRGTAINSSSTGSGLTCTLLDEAPQTVSSFLHGASSASGTGSITGTTLTVTAGGAGFGPQLTLSGPNITLGTKITAGTGPTYTVTPSQSAASGPISADSVSGVGALSNNYFDLTGAFNAFYGGTMTTAQGWTPTNNIDMMTGKVLVPA